ncbi:MAG: hypothetical protein ACO21C_02540 [Burkholderiaceae bacterium]
MASVWHARCAGLVITSLAFYAGSAWSATSGHAAAPAPATPSAQSAHTTPAAKPAPPAYQHTASYQAAEAKYNQIRALQAQAFDASECIRKKDCPSDESDMLRPLEQALLLKKELESLAAGGDRDAAYFRAKVAAEESARFGEEGDIYTGFRDPAYKRSAGLAYERAVREREFAKSTLVAGAIDLHPWSCMLYADLNMVAQPGVNNRDAAFNAYYCAASGFADRGLKDLALKAYAGMLKTGHPQHPYVLDIHARLLNNRPENPWRQIESTGVVRKPASPVKANPH